MKHVKKHALVTAAAALVIGGSSLAFGGLTTNSIATVLGYNPFVPFVGPLTAAQANFVGPLPVAKPVISTSSTIKVSKTLLVNTSEKPKKSKKNTNGNNGLGNGYDDPQPPGNPPVNDGSGTSLGNPGNKGGVP